MVDALSSYLEESTHPLTLRGKKQGNAARLGLWNFSLFTELLQRCGSNLGSTLLRMFILTWSGQAHLVGNTLAFGIRQLWSWNMVSLFWSFRILGNWLSYSKPKFPVRWISSHFWRRQWQPTPVLLPGKSHGQRILVGYGPRGRKELHTTEPLQFQFSFL